MASDLFGRPIYDGGRAVQPALFNEEHWFKAGYRDFWYGCESDGSECEAYQYGYEAAKRDYDNQGGTDAGNDPDRAFRQARAVGNVE